jgi:hypothetical protein
MCLPQAFWDLLLLDSTVVKGSGSGFFGWCPQMALMDLLPGTHWLADQGRTRAIALSTGGAWKSIATSNNYSDFSVDWSKSASGQPAPTITQKYAFLEDRLQAKYSTKTTIPTAHDQAYIMMR